MRLELPLAGSSVKLAKHNTAALLYTQHYKISIKNKVEQSIEWSSALPNTSV